MTTRKIRLGRYVILIFLFRTIRSEHNVALNKATEHSSDIGDGRFVASNAVDNCTDFDNDCCTHTREGQKTAWWRVDLGELMTITSIKIYYRDDVQHRLAGYQLYVSNITNTPTEGVLCYEDTSSTRDDVQLLATHQCPYVGRYVTVYNYRNPKRYNWYSDDAILELCEVQVFGCQVGRYGDGDCSNTCSEACYGGNCNSKTGACFYCFTGKYGHHCTSDCSRNCEDNVCSKDTGICFECVPEKHGIRCENNCSTNCLGSLCENIFGLCYDCVPQKYGVLCDQDCSTNCSNGLCQKDGYCNECISGKYDNTCDQDCPENCKDMLCDKSTGDCTDCVPQRYGITCEQDCSANCQGRLCENVNGICNECVPGKYGINCDQNCPGNCKDVCERDTGSCTDCYPGKYGVVCGADCPDTCKDNICSKDDGQCLATGLTTDSNLAIISVLAAVCGLLLTVLAVALFLRRKRQNKKSLPDKDTEQSVPKTGYTSVSPRQEETPHVYEMVT